MMQNIGLTIKQDLQVREEWYNFVAGKTVDRSKVSPEIYSSWIRSKNYQVDPFDEKQGASDVNKSHDPDLSPVIIDSYKAFVDGQDFAIQLSDEKGQVVLPEYGQKRESLLKNYGFTYSLNVREEILGTNAIGLTLKTRKPCFIYRSQYYKKALQDLWGLAFPIYDNMGNLLGVANAHSVVDDLQIIMQAYRLIKMFVSAMIIFKNYLLETDDIRILNRVFKHMPDGICFLDDRNIQYYCNQKYEEMLKNHRHLNIKNEINTLVDKIDKSIYLREVTQNVEEKDQQLTIFARKIVDDKRDIGKLVVLRRDNKAVKTKKRFERKNITPDYTFEDIVGEDEKIILAKENAKIVSPSDLPVLIQGETGTGKEMFAQSIHNASKRAAGPFIAINCGAIPADLVESELFGYAPGSFTGALKTGKIGKIEAANGGTLFLDEIESMPLYVQIKLLRVLSIGRIQKIGEVQESQVDVRIISATKKDLLKLADQGCFRDDLYYRLSTMKILLPPLRERKNDIPILAKHIIQQMLPSMGIDDICIEDEFYDYLTTYTWRGNVRELINVITKALLFMDTETKELNQKLLPGNIIEEYFQEEITNLLDRSPLYSYKENMLKAGEDIIIENVLRKTNLNLTKSSEILGITRQTLYNKIKNNDKFTKMYRKKN